MRAAAAPLRFQRKRVFKADLRTSPYCVRWEVLRPPAPGREPALIWELRRAVRELGAAGAESAEPLVAVGLGAVARALERGEALAVLLCASEGVASGLVQHVPVMCGVRDVTVAILGTSPRALGEAIAPLAPCLATKAGQRGRGAAAVAVAFLTRASGECPRLATFVQLVRQTAPKVKTPFLLPAAGVPRYVPARPPTARRARRRKGAEKLSGEGDATAVHTQPLETLEAPCSEPSTPNAAASFASSSLPEAANKRRSPRGLSEAAAAKAGAAAAAEAKRRRVGTAPASMAPAGMSPVGTTAPAVAAAAAAGAKVAAGSGESAAASATASAAVSGAGVNRVAAAETSIYDFFAE